MSASDLRPGGARRPYLTIIPLRTPREKAHTSLGHAKNAVRTHVYYSGARCDMAVYQWSDEMGDWDLLYAIDRGQTVMPWEAGS